MCVCLCALPCTTPRSFCHYKEKHASTVAARQAPEALVTHKTETCKTQCVESNIEIFANTISVCLCTGNVFFFFLNPASQSRSIIFHPAVLHTPLLVQPFIRALQICQVHSSDCLACHQGCIIHCSLLIPSPPHLIAGCYFLIIQSGAACHAFVPTTVASQNDGHLALDPFKPAVGRLLFISPIIGVREILVVGDRITIFE